MNRNQWQSGMNALIGSAIYVQNILIQTCDFRITAPIWIHFGWSLLFFYNGNPSSTRLTLHTIYIFRARVWLSLSTVCRSTTHLFWLSFCFNPIKLSFYFVSRSTNIRCATGMSIKSVFEFKQWAYRERRTSCIYFFYVICVKEGFVISCIQI